MPSAKYEQTINAINADSNLVGIATQYDNGKGYS